MPVKNLAQKRHRLRKLRGEAAYVDATAARLHIATLTGVGWSLRSISGASGVATSTVSRLAQGPNAKAAPQTIARILAVDAGQVPVKASRQTTEPFVPRVGCVRRLQALMFMGYSHDDLRREGIDSRNLLNQRGRWITRTNHDRVAAVFSRLWSTPGPTPRSARRARSLGYVGPLAWDDIDSDSAPATPCVEVTASMLDEAAIQRRCDGDRRVHLTLGERRELVRRLHARGLNDMEAARVAGYSDATFLRIRKQLGLPAITPGQEIA